MDFSFKTFFYYGPEGWKVLLSLDGNKDIAMQYYFKFKNYNVPVFWFCYKYEVCLMMYLILTNNTYSLYFSK